MARSKSPIGGRQKDLAANPVVNPVTREVPPARDARTVTSGAPEVEGRPESKKVFGMAKNDPRPHVVPINLEDEIRRRAYELAERRGFSEGHETEDWLAAEREVLQRYRQQSA